MGKLRNTQVFFGLLEDIYCRYFEYPRFTLVLLEFTSVNMPKVTLDTYLDFGRSTPSKF